MCASTWVKKSKTKQNQTLVKSCCNFKPVPAVQSPKQPLWQSLSILSSSFLFIHISVSINSTLQLANRHLDMLGFKIKTQSSPLLRLLLKQLTPGENLGFLPGSLLSEDAGKIKRKQKYIYILNNNIQIWGKVFQLCQRWSVQTQLKDFDKVTKTPQLKAQYHPSKPNQPNPSTHTGRAMSLWKMTGTVPQTLPLALMFCTPSPSIMSFCTAFPYKGALGDVGVSNPEPTFQNTLRFEKPIFVSQRNKEVRIIKSLSPQTQSLPYS